jgi:hypothetical protein
MEKTWNNRPIESRDTVLLKDMPNFAQQGASQSDKPTQGAGISSKSRDVEHVTTVKDRRAQGVLKM